MNVQALTVCFMEQNGATDEHLITCPSLDVQILYRRMTKMEFILDGIEGKG